MAHIRLTRLTRSSSICDAVLSGSLCGGGVPCGNSVCALAFSFTGALYTWSGITRPPSCRPGHRGLSYYIDTKGTKSVKHSFLAVGKFLLHLHPFPNTLPISLLSMPLKNHATSPLRKTYTPSFQCNLPLTVHVLCCQKKSQVPSFLVLRGSGRTGVGLYNHPCHLALGSWLHVVTRFWPISRYMQGLGPSDQVKLQPHRTLCCGVARNVSLNPYETVETMACMSSWRLPGGSVALDAMVPYGKARVSKCGIPDSGAVKLAQSPVSDMERMRFPFI